MYVYRSSSLIFPIFFESSPPHVITSITTPSLPGITISSHRSFIVVFGMLASFATVSATIIQQPFYNNFLNEFDTTATTATANTLVASFIMIWSVVYDYEYTSCFHTASLLQAATAVVFLAFSFRRSRR